MTTDKEIELCAKALGYEVLQVGSGVFLNCTGMLAAQNILTAPPWRPRTDQADSDNMACDLEITTLWNPLNTVYCHSTEASSYVEHDGTTEGRRAAAREARVRVAAEMGRAIK